RRLTGNEIIERYRVSSGVSSEFAYIELKRFIDNKPVDSQRALLVSKQSGSIRKTLFRLLQPPEVEGVSLLLKGADKSEEPEIHLYLPEIGATRKIRSTQQGGTPFMGSDFNMQDLMEELPGENVYARLADKVVNGMECFVVRAKPLAQQTQSGFSRGYSQRDLYISKSTYNLLQVDFYRGLGTLVKNMQAFGYDSGAVIGETRRPERLVMFDIEKNSMSVIKVIESRLNERVDDQLLTAQGISSMTTGQVEDLLFGFTTIDVE
ncbi:MAG: outer membrane lipoprotein-sorting protein, partial [Verrucomicrobiota bacterium]